MQSYRQADRSTRLKTCYATLQTYNQSQSQNTIKNWVTTNKVNPNLLQYSSKHDARCSKVPKLNTKKAINQGYNPQGNIFCNKTGIINVSKLKIHSSQRYSKKADDCTVVSRHKIKSYLRAKIQKEFNFKLLLSGAQQVVVVDKTVENNGQMNCLINKKLEQILSKFGRTTGFRSRKNTKYTKRQCETIKTQGPENSFVNQIKAKFQVPSRTTNNYQITSIADNTAKISAWDTYSAKSQN